MQSPVQARTPFSAAGTPPATPARQALASPHRTPAYVRPPTDDFPESPTRPMRHVDPLLRPPAFKLGAPPTPSSSSSAGGPPRRKAKRDSWGEAACVPRALSTPRRVLYALFIALVATLAVRLAVARLKRTSIPARLKRFGKDGMRLLMDPIVEPNDGLCRFVSPLDAYHRDLERLRRLYPELAARSIHANVAQSSTGNDSAPDDTAELRRRQLHAAHQHHLFSPTGHLLVADTAGAPHPIPALLQLGEKRWEDLLVRQSRTLGEAVAEYKRRYGRRPPRGFDQWWAYAMKHHLVLPDEYDRISLDLAPFFALPKAEMKKRMEWVEDMKETFTITVENGRVDIEIKDEGGLKWGGTWPRALDAASLIQSFAHVLPDLRATFSIFDQPQIYLSWARRNSLVDLGLHGEREITVLASAAYHTDTGHLIETDDAHVHLSRSCSPDSNYRTNTTVDTGKSFIYDSGEASDFCQNPYLVPIHGLTIEPHEPSSHPMPHTQLLPLFSLAKTSLNSDILITPLEQFADSAGIDPKWEDKTDLRLAWRGSPTGISMMTQDLDWRSSHRVRLHHFANNHSLGETTILAPDIGIDDEEAERPWRRVRRAAPADGGDGRQRRIAAARAPLRYRTETATTADANAYFFDIKLAGGPIQCSSEDGTCDEMEREVDWAGYQSPQSLNKHKFLLDIDGNGWSGRFRRLMSTRSLVIKSTVFTEWYEPHLVPWFMYVPAKLDYSDLADILAFFRGSMEHPELAFDETAKAIGRNGRMFRMEDLTAYMFRLFIEYARIAADEGVDMDFYLEGEDAGDDIAEIVDVNDDVLPGKNDALRAGAGGGGADWDARSVEVVEAVGESSADDGLDQQEVPVVQQDEESL